MTLPFFLYRFYRQKQKTAPKLGSDLIIRVFHTFTIGNGIVGCQAGKVIGIVYCIDGHGIVLDRDREEKPSFFQEYN
jgi:hypothetical protein